MQSARPTKAAIWANRPQFDWCCRLLDIQGNLLATGIVGALTIGEARRFAKIHFSLYAKTPMGGGYAVVDSPHRSLRYFSRKQQFLLVEEAELQ